MTHAWRVDLVASLLGGLVVVMTVLAAGGPLWAAFGFGLLFYLLREPTAQRTWAMTRCSRDDDPTQHDEPRR